MNLGGWTRTINCRSQIPVPFQFGHAQIVDIPKYPFQRNIRQPSSSCIYSLLRLLCPKMRNGDDGSRTHVHNICLPQTVLRPSHLSFTAFPYPVTGCGKAGGIPTFVRSFQPLEDNTFSASLPNGQRRDTHSSASSVTRYPGNAVLVPEIRLRLNFC